MIQWNITPHLYHYTTVQATFNTIIVYKPFIKFSYIYLTHLRFGDPMSCQLNHGEVAFADGPFDVVKTNPNGTLAALADRVHTSVGAHQTGRAAGGGRRRRHPGNGQH